MKRFKPGEALAYILAVLLVAGLGIGVLAFFCTMVKWLVWAVIG